MYQPENGPRPEFNDPGGFSGQNEMPRGAAPSCVHKKASSVLSYPFKGNHLLEVALMHQVQNHAWKHQFFCFIKLLPGGKNGQDRTYITDKHITMKLSLDRTLEFAKALRAYASGSGERLGPFTTFTDTSKAGVQGDESSAGKKSVSIFYPSDRQTQTPNMQKIMITVKRGQDNYTFSATPYFAGSMADIFERVALEGIDMEMERQKKLARQAVARRSAA